MPLRARHTTALASLLILFSARAVHAQERWDESNRDLDRLGWAVPDFAKLQTGGFSGAVTVGLGYAMLQDHLNVAALYGYVPVAVGRDVHSVHLTLSGRPGEIRFQQLGWLPLYGGLGALCTWGPGYFVVPPKRYPRAYYYPTALRASVLVGTELDWVSRRGPFERHGAYFELTTLDFLLLAQLRNPRVVRLTDIVSSTLGYRFSF